MQDLRVNLIQSDLVWEQPEHNLRNFDVKLSGLRGQQDIVALPEMFNTGFTMNGTANSEAPDGKAFQWMKAKAKELDCVVTGTFLCKDQDQLFNRLVWMRPDGSYETYNKRHLFRFGNEHLYFVPGALKLIVEIKGWRVCPLICYDLRFPVWAKNTFEDGRFEYDLLLYIANWPERRKHHWRALLQARAIENLSYSIGINRIGTDGIGTAHSGNSLVYSPKGELMCEPQEHAESNTIVTLSANELMDYRQKFNVGLDWDKFSIL
ncbi:MAG: amidohydrolase [Bacteroidota bacterium]